MRPIFVASGSTILSIPMAVSPALAQAREWGDHLGLPVEK